MELVGHEKRIQELFRELRLADERIAPPFVAVWNRAKSNNLRPNPAFKVSFAVTAVMLVTIFSFALWSRFGKRSQQPYPTVASGSTNPIINPTPEAKNPELKPRASLESLHVVRINWRARKLAARRHAELLAQKAAIREAVALSSWQSPTITLLRSPADEVLTSLPQLNQTINELKSFLPNTPN